jgi:HEAT repeat protein
LEHMAKQMVSAGMEGEWLDHLSAADSRAVLAYFLRTLPDAEVAAAERVRDVLRRSRLVRRELGRLNGRSALRRAEACRILGGLGEAEAIPRLVERLRDRDPVVRREAAGALAGLRAVETLPAIAVAIEETEGWGDLLTVMTLVRMGPAGVPRVGALLAASRSPAMTKALLQVTTQLRAASDPALVRSLATHPEMEIRVEALRALGSLGPDAEAVSVCLAAMDDPEWPARALAASSLGRLGEPRAIPRLEKAMGDPAYWVRHHVAEAIAEMGEAGEAALTRGLAHANPFVRDMAAQALYLRAMRRGRAA